jgi:prepilin-type N-terminal cleavage/methylation domain-containing protein
MPGWSAHPRCGAVRQVLSLGGIGLVAVLFVVAGLLKIRDLDLFRSSLDSWVLIPDAFRSIVAVIIPVVEITLGAAWLLKIGQRRVAVVMFFLVLSFTSVYAIHRILGYSPHCACLGEALRLDALWRESDVVIMRNTALLAILALGYFGAYRGASEGADMKHRNGSLKKRNLHRGFTIIESLFVVAIVGVLVALLSTGLGLARRKSRVIVDRSNLHQHVGMMSVYSTDWSGAYPLFLNPRVAHSELRWGSHDLVFDLPYFMSSLAWPIAMADSYYNQQVSEGVFWSPQEPKSRSESGDTAFATTSYSYPCVFIAKPGYWVPDSRRGDPAKQTGITRVSDVRYSSAKVNLVLRVGGWSDLNHAIADGRLLTAMCDGSVAGIERAEAVPAIVDADGAAARPEWSFHFRDWPSLHHTPFGVLGRDFQQR